MAEPRDQFERAVPVVVMIGYWLLMAASLLTGLALVVAGAGALVGGDSNWTVFGVRWTANMDALTIAVYFAVGFAMMGWAVWVVLDDFGRPLLDRNAGDEERASAPARQAVVWRAEGALGHGREAGEELLRVLDAYAVAFTAGGALATVGAGGLYLWDLPSAGELVHLPDATGHVAVSRDGRHVAMTHQDFGIELRSLRDGQNRWTVAHRSSAWKGGFGGVSALAFSLDGRRLASGGDPDTRVWSVADGSELLRIPTGPTELYGLVIDFSPDGRFLATTVTDRSVCVWDSSDGRRVQRLSHPTRYGRVATGLAFSPESSRLATLCADDSVWVWDLVSGNLLLELPSRRPPHFFPRTLVWSPDARCLFVPGSDGNVRGWDIASGREILSVQHAVPATRSRPTPWSVVDDAVFGTASCGSTAAAISPDGTMLATAGSGMARLWALDGCTGDT